MSVPLTAEAAALAHYYDLDLLDDPGDLDLYLALAERADGPILELACGSGRLAVPLATAGHEVVGIDRDAAMLARAARRWTEAGAGSVPPAAKTPAAPPRPVGGGAARTDGRGTRGSFEPIEGDLYAASLGARFALVVLALNTLLMLGDARRQREALAVMSRHLRPAGLAVVDVWLPGPDDLALFDGRVVQEWLRRDDATGERVLKTASGRYDAALRVIELDTCFDVWPAAGGPVVRHARHDEIHLSSADELVAAAESGGLSVEQLAGDYALAPFGAGAERAVLVARAR